MASRRSPPRSSLGTIEEMQTRVDGVVAERERVYDEIVALDLDVVASEANFLWLPFGEYAAVLGAYGERAGVVLRVFPEVRAGHDRSPRGERPILKVLRAATEDGAAGYQRAWGSPARSNWRTRPTSACCSRCRGSLQRTLVARPGGGGTSASPSAASVAFESLEKPADIVARARRHEAGAARERVVHLAADVAPRFFDPAAGRDVRDVVRRSEGSRGAPAEDRRRLREVVPVIGIVTDDAVDAVIDRTRPYQFALEAHADEDVGIDARARRPVRGAGRRQTLRASLRGLKLAGAQACGLATSRC